MLHSGSNPDRRAWLDVARQVIVGGAVAYLASGIVWVLFWTVADTQAGVELNREDGLFEWFGAGAFLATRHP